MDLFFSKDDDQLLHTMDGSQPQSHLSYVSNDVASQRVSPCHSTNTGEPNMPTNASISSGHEDSSESELDSSFRDSEWETVVSIQNEKEDREAMNCSSEEGDEELSEVEDEENTSSVEAIDTVSSSADGTNSVSSDISVKICLICLQGGNVVTCAACGLPVHRRCYGSNLFPQNVAQWFCDTCCSIGQNSSGSDAPFCVLCPVRGGAMRVTDVGNYFHVVCAMVHKKLLDENDALCERPNLLELASQFGQNPCVLCKDSEFACCGVSVLCDSGLCKKSMHVSCAQRAGLFVHDAEPNVFYVWCYDHRDIEASKHNKKLYKEIIQHMLNFSRSDLSIKPTKKLEQTVSKNLTATMKDDVEIPATAFAEFITLDHRKKEKLCQNKMHANQALRKKRLARRSIELYIDGILFDKSIPVAFSEEFFYYYHARAEALRCTNEFNEKMENKCNAIEAVEKEALKRVHPAVREVVKIFSLTGKDICGGELTALDGKENDYPENRPVLLLPSVSSDEETTPKKRMKQDVRSLSKSEAVSQNSKDSFIPHDKAVKALRRSPRFARHPQALPSKESNHEEESSGQVADCLKNLPSYNQVAESESMSPLELADRNESANAAGQNYAASPPAPEELTKSQVILDVPKEAEKFEADAMECGEASCSTTEVDSSKMISSEMNAQEEMPSMKDSRWLRSLTDESDNSSPEKSINVSIAQPSYWLKNCKQPDEHKAKLIADEIALGVTDSTQYVDEKACECQKSNGINFNEALSGLKHIALNLKATKSATAQQFTANSTSAEYVCESETSAAASASPVILQKFDEPIRSRHGSSGLLECQEGVCSSPIECTPSRSGEIMVWHEDQNSSILLEGVSYHSVEQQLSTVFPQNSEYDVTLLQSATNEELTDKRSNEYEVTNVDAVNQQLTECEELTETTEEKVISSESVSDNVVYLVPCEEEKVEVQLSMPDVSVEYEDVPTIGMEVYVNNSESSTTVPPRPLSAELPLPSEVSNQSERRKRTKKRRNPNSDAELIIHVEDIV